MFRLVTQNLFVRLLIKKNVQYNPFKFNTYWLEENFLCDFVHEKWHHYTQSVHSTPILSIVNKFSLLKEDVALCEKENKSKNEKEFAQIELEIEMISSLVDERLFLL